MKPERTQQRLSQLDGWVMVKKRSQNRSGEEVPNGVWTAFELADHREACELVREIGEIADRACTTPEIDVRRNVVFITARTNDTLTEEDFDFAEAIDREIGNGLRAKSLILG